MTPERWRMIKRILADVANVPAVERPGRIEAAAGGDTALIAEVLGFLDHEDQLPGFIETPILALDFPEQPRPEASPAGDEIGRKLGPYRLVELLGEGGMGAVFLAEREEEFEQRVALKLVRRGLRSDQATRLFHAERQILARLEHPNIARLLDGGTDENGAPYFVMERIDGLPIDRYCDEHGLATRQRVELFLPICSALAAAHQRLIVHHDLKPGNILVATDGTPKLVDFGIAKLLDPASGIGPAPDPSRPIALTPRYASPEQIRGEAVGTASDVYSLGLVLYKVLTGHLPRELDARERLALAETLHHDEPLPASVIVQHEARLPRADGTVDLISPRSISRARDENPASLARRLSGDLDAILAKALRQDASRRYASIERLAGDLRSYLSHRPVSARPPRFLYRSGKFIRRHRLGVANAALMLLLAVAFTVALVDQLYETRRSRDRAEEVSSFLVELFQAAAPDRPTGVEPTVRDLLDIGRLKLESALEQAPEVRAILLLRLGEVYAKLGDNREARELLTEAIALLRLGRPASTADLATALGDLSVVQFQSGDSRAAELSLRESLELRQALGQHEDLVKPMNNLATMLLARGEARQAEKIYRQTLDLRRALAAAAPEDLNARGNLATSLRSLAVALFASGDLDEAESLLVESLALRREIYGADSPKVATVELSLGRLEHARGDLAKAETWISNALATRVRELGDDHLHTALARRDLALLKIESGEPAAARELLTRALATLVDQRPADDPEIIEVRALLDQTGSPAEDQEPPARSLGTRR